MSRTSVLIAVLLLGAVAGCTTHEASSPPPRQTLSAFQPTPEARASDRAYVYLDAMRADLSRGKVQVFTSVMHLSPAEGKTFWPIYHDYEDELFALGDQRMELTRRFAQALQAQSLNDAAAGQFGNAWWDFESQRQALQRKYYDRIASEMSPMRAAQFAQIEHRCNVVIDLMVASEVPLIGRGS